MVGGSYDAEPRVGGRGDREDRVTAPYEMFSVNATHIKTNSPFDFTVVVTCSGVHRSYIPSQKAFEYGCYESTSAYYEPGTGELLADQYVAMLNQLKGQ